MRHGAYVNAGAVLGSHASIGCHANVNRASTIGHDSRLGFAAATGPGVVLAGGVVVEAGAFVGAGATVLPELTIGAGATVGAGAVVTKDVASGRRGRGQPRSGAAVAGGRGALVSTLLSDLDRPAPIVLAPTGMVPTRAMTPHVPLTPAEIAADVAAAASVGITSVHLHARDEDGDPTWEREVYQRIVGAVREAAPDVLINVSTSGRTWSEVERRADCLALDGDLKPDLASLTLSSLNFLTQASINSPDTIHALAQIMLDRGIVPELELFDFGMVNYVHVLQRKGLLPGPVVTNMFFGNVAGMQATLAEMGLAVDRLPPDTIWSGAGLGDFGLTGPVALDRGRAAAYASGWRTASGSTAGAPGWRPTRCWSSGCTSCSPCTAGR